MNLAISECQWNMIPHEALCIPNTLRPRQNGHYFPDNFLKWIFLNGNVWILIKILLMFVPRGPINNIPALVQIAWPASSHYLKQWWLIQCHIYVSLGLNELLPHNWRSSSQIAVNLRKRQGVRYPSGPHGCWTDLSHQLSLFAEQVQVVCWREPSVYLAIPLPLPSIRMAVLAHFHFQTFTHDVCWYITGVSFL